MTLARLSALLKVGPPSLAFLVDLVQNLESVQAFMDLVAEYLPEQVEEIRSMQTPQERVTHFAQVFSNRYFPLDDSYWDEEAYASFLSYIPVPRLGIEDDAYHETEGWCPGMKIMLAFVASPYGPWGEDGARVPLLLEVTKLLGRQLAQRIPQDGYAPANLHTVLDGTPYEALASFGDVLHHDHENVFLNITYETDISDADWSMETVKCLTDQWPEAQRVWDQINHLSETIEEDPRNAVSTLLTMIAAHEVSIEERTGQPLVDLFGTTHAYHHSCGCVLDLDTEKLTTVCNTRDCTADYEDGWSPRDAIRTIAQEEGYGVNAVY